MKRLARLIRVVAGAAAIAGCASQPSTSPITPSTSAILMRSNSDASPAPAVKAARSGTLHVVKECHEYQGGAGQFCTVTASSVKEIEPGSTVTYLSAAVDGLLDSDLILKLPGPGENRAFGHVAINLGTGVGTVTFSRGTGKFTHLRTGDLAVSFQGLSSEGWPPFAGEGAYSFPPPGGTDK